MHRGPFRPQLEALDPRELLTDGLPGVANFTFDLPNGMTGSGSFTFPAVESLDLNQDYQAVPIADLLLVVEGESFSEYDFTSAPIARFISGEFSGVSFALNGVFASSLAYLSVRGGVATAITSQGQEISAAVSLSGVPDIPPPGPGNPPPPANPTPEELAQLKLDYELSLLRLGHIYGLAGVRAERIDELFTANETLEAERPTATPARQAVIDVLLAANRAEILENQVANSFLSSEFQAVLDEANAQRLILMAFLPADQRATLPAPIPLELADRHFAPPGTIL